MNTNLMNFGLALEAIEEESGLEVLSQLLATSLLACSKRTSGHTQNNWSVTTGFVKGEVTVITDVALLKLNQ